MTATPPGLADRQALRACLYRIVTEAERMRATLPQLNQVDPGLENRINLLLTTVERTVAAHLDEPGDGLADDLEGLRSGTRHLKVPAEEPGLGETFALRELGAVQGRMLNAVLDALDVARDQGLQPTAGSIEKDLGIDIPRTGNEDVLGDIAARLDEVVEQLDQLERTRTEGSDFRAEGRLLDFYIGKMRVQVDLARLQLRIGERTVDFGALWRATQSMSDLTQGFVATVQAWLGRASTAVTKLASRMGRQVRSVADGMRVAVRTILRRRQGGVEASFPTPPRSQSPGEPPGYFDIDVAKAMILRGEAPPVAWRPFITILQFAPASFIGGRTELSDLRPLAGLTNLESLYLLGTQVRDVTPLGGLTALRFLDLSGTPVSDITPLGTLTALQSLNLMSTPVSDVTPLGALTALQSLNLMGTPVRDVTPLGALTALQSLNLGRTQVRDVTPLGMLTALRSLYLMRTQVRDVTPLSALIDLRSLVLEDTPISDVTPLSALTALRSLDLRNTQVSDVTPLCVLTALRSLILKNTQVSTVKPLSVLAALQSLDLASTHVNDVTPLAPLMELAKLDLTGITPNGVDLLRRPGLEIIGGDQVLGAPRPRWWYDR